MRRILIAGCGYVGQAAADLFHEREWKVEGWTASVQSAGQLAGKPYAVRAVDITNAAEVSAIGGEFDVIVQCASSGGGDAEKYRRIYVEGARALLGAFPRARLIFTGSTSVYAQRNGDIVDETSPANPAQEKGRILREAEELVLSRHGIVARLAGIYGPGRSFFLRTFLSGKAAVDAEKDRFINQAHRDDIVSALFLLAEGGADLGGQIYNVVDDRPIPTSEAYRWLSAHLRKPLPAGRLAGERKRGDSNKRVSNTKLRALGWEPRFPDFPAGMAKSVLPSFGFE
ncbi:MAG TPA: NAD-dependent epimerase/dehydratase family protein [Chthoniobacterales bacterium]|nr:NAD-dependent epimerase/dehydratase family protein [Chthoniobacterales bacterium]